MGYDMYQVADFIDQKCICENDFGIVMDNLQNANYVNVLRPIMYQQPQMQVPQQFANANPLMKNMAMGMQQQLINTGATNLAYQQQPTYQQQPGAPAGQPVMMPMGQAPQGQPVNYNYQPQN